LHRNKINPFKIIYSLSYQIAQRFPNFATLVENIIKSKDITTYETNNNLEELFNTLLINPLTDMDKHYQPIGNRRFLILIDNLHELGKQSCDLKRQFYECLIACKQTLPDKYGILFTTNSEVTLPRNMLTFMDLDKEFKTVAQTKEEPIVDETFFIQKHTEYVQARLFEKCMNILFSIAASNELNKKDIEQIIIAIISSPIKLHWKHHLPQFSKCELAMIKKIYNKTNLSHLFPIDDHGFIKPVYPSLVTWIKGLNLLYHIHFWFEKTIDIREESSQTRAVIISSQTPLKQGSKKLERCITISHHQRYALLDQTNSDLTDYFANEDVTATLVTEQLSDLLKSKYHFEQLALKRCPFPGELRNNIGSFLIYSE